MHRNAAYNYSTEQEIPLRTPNARATLRLPGWPAVALEPQRGLLGPVPPMLSIIQPSSSALAPACRGFVLYYGKEQRPLTMYGVAFHGQLLAPERLTRWTSLMDMAWHSSHLTSTSFKLNGYKCCESMFWLASRQAWPFPLACVGFLFRKTDVRWASIQSAAFLNEVLLLDGSSTVHTISKNTYVVDCAHTVRPK